MTTTIASADDPGRTEIVTLDEAVLLGDDFSRSEMHSRRRLFRFRKVRALKRRIDEQLGEAPKTISKAFEKLIMEADFRAHQRRVSSARWARSYYMFGAPSAILATLAATLTQSDLFNSYLVSGLALASAALTTLVTFLSSERNRDRALALSAGWTALADDARLDLLNYLPKIKNKSDDELQLIREEYMHKIFTLNSKKGILLRGEVPEGDSAPPSVPPKP